MLALVVDDEPLLRIDAVELVERAGHRVIEASNAKQALSIIRENPGVELLFTDVQMPGDMDGVALAQAFLAERPHSCVVVTSGKSVDQSKLPRRAVFIPKPYSSRALSDAIAKACGIEIKPAARK